MFLVLCMLPFSSAANTKPRSCAPLIWPSSTQGQLGPQPPTGLHPLPSAKRSSHSQACHSETSLGTWALRASSIQFFKGQCLLFSLFFFFPFGEGFVCFSGFVCFNFVTLLHNTWPFSSRTRDRTHTPCIRSAESLPLDLQGTPSLSPLHLGNWITG